jgi:transketolase
VVYNFQQLQLRLLDQCYRYSRTHLGSAFSSLEIINEIYGSMKVNDRFILSNGHAAAALYVVLEKFRDKDSTIYFENMGDHPKRNTELLIDCSTGSLGMGVTAAAGMALANREANVYCLVSDGECAEGSVWETLRFMEKENLRNFHLYFNFNGWSAYDEINTKTLARQILSVFPKANIRFTDLFPFEKQGLGAHYLKMNEDDYLEARRRICEKILHQL